MLCICYTLPVLLSLALYELSYLRCLFSRNVLPRGLYTARPPFYQLGMLSGVVHRTSPLLSVKDVVAIPGGLTYALGR